ncbi:hypothetical protein AVDCRST_MAG92-768 [uncultured Coleofasciculus sp.]|uniref:Uncharacterized protein n=1 Tax=uncultured Coleofasciculus sp. TaxID=1267456 RepID=A0A6J4HK44_9CYAN|nr:hypothetical protein AVDCRST_MAG92-768 [uncultured Coleofasciculus sp.]
MLPNFGLESVSDYKQITSVNSKTGLRAVLSSPLPVKLPCQKSK